MDLFSNLALASIVSWDNALILVLETSDDPGSLKAMCPSGPIPVQQVINNTSCFPVPPMNSSTPPASFIFCSNASHSATRSGALPSSM